jgi:hypothetical protein
VRLLQCATQGVLATEAIQFRLGTVVESVSGCSGDFDFLLSLQISDAHILGTLRAGAVGYILKSTADDGAFTAIRNVHRRERHVAPYIAIHIADNLGQENIPPAGLRRGQRRDARHHIHELIARKDATAERSTADQYAI